ncbi:hypothetical protein ACEYW6_28710 [Nostoc sp. UIC 10607]
MTDNRQQLTTIKSVYRASAYFLPLLPAPLLPHPNYAVILPETKTAWN